MKLGLFGRRRSSVEKAEAEWLRAQKRDEIVWDDFKLQLEQDEKIWAELDSEQKSVQLDERPKPPPCPRRAAADFSASADKEEEKTGKRDAEQFVFTKKKPPPPPPRRLPAPEEGIGAAVTIEAAAMEESRISAAVTQDLSQEQKVRRHRRPQGARVAALVASWERMADQAEAEAARRLALLREDDKGKLAAYFAAKREALKALKRDTNAVLPPRFTNVASDPAYLDILISSSSDCAQAKISYCIPSSEEENRAWIIAPAPVRIRHEGMGRLVIVAKVMTDDGRVSGLASSVFWLTPPREISPNIKHPSGLTWIDHSENETAHMNQSSKVALICADCGTKLGPGTRKNIDFEARDKAADINRGYYRSKNTTDLNTKSFVLCYDCALLAEVRRDKLNKPSPPAKGERPPSVVLDTGARRLWLSDPIHFVGNLAVIKEDSYPMLNLLAGTLRRNPGLCVRLEGHTNSGCGLDCDGTRPCTNNTCQENFGDGKGGAVGFSLSRASAVRDWLLTNGAVDKETVDLRIDVAGLGGSRRIIQDTEATNNHRNRRVEAHIIDFVEGEL